MTIAKFKTVRYPFFSLAPTGGEGWGEGAVCDHCPTLLFIKRHA